MLKWFKFNLKNTFLSLLLFLYSNCNQNLPFKTHFLKILPNFVALVFLESLGNKYD